MSRDTTPEEGNRNIEEHIQGLFGHLLDMNSNFAVPAVGLAVDRFGTRIQYSKPWATHFSKECTNALHTWAQLSLTDYEEESL